LDTPPKTYETGECRKRCQGFSWKKIQFQAFWKSSRLGDHPATLIRISAPSSQRFSSSEEVKEISGTAGG